MISRQSRYGEVAHRPAVEPYLNLFLQQSFLASVTPAFASVTLEALEQKVKAKPGVHFSATELVVAAERLEDVANHRAEIVPLVRTSEPRAQYPTEANSAFLIGKVPNDYEVKPAILVIPGGGFSFVAMDTEGLSLWPELEAAGFRVFILHYRVAPHRYPAAQVDATLALQYLIANADHYGINPTQIWGMGFSAGGHIVSSIVEHWQEYQLDLQAPETADGWRTSALPQCPLAGTVLGYPRISYVTEQVTSRTFLPLTGLADETTNWALANWLSVEAHVTAANPPTFLWACADDGLLPIGDHVLRFDAALQKAGVSHQTVIYPTGNHGIGRARGTDAEPWLAEALSFIKNH